MSQQLTKLAPLFVLALLAVGCNPFAPKLDEGAVKATFGDARTIDGYFQAFKYAYQFKDTTLYASLLQPDFTFSYRNYDRGLDLEWGRDEEVRTTGSLFANSQSLNLLWGNILDSTSEATSSDITLAFSLDVTFNAADIEHVDGFALFHLERDGPGAPWRAQRWRDESNL